jgi:hypothetical protein
VLHELDEGFPIGDAVFARPRLQRAPGNRTDRPAAERTFAGEVFQRHEHRRQVLGHRRRRRKRGNGHAGAGKRG